MTAEIDNLVLEHLRAIRAKQDEHDERFSRIESHMYGDVVEQRADYDRLAARLDRIEKRLELTDPAH